MAQNLMYTGAMEHQPAPGEIDENTHQSLYPYLPNDELKEAVNLAIFLERPLFLRGEPGCGKTRLARAVAHELNLPYLSWSVKSVSRAQDGLYSYDAVGRLHDAQLAKLSEKPEKKENVSEIEKYISYGPLGKAFQNTERTVVLIDEIDKADIDFPNDLLLELDEKRFEISELGGKVIQAKEAPIVFITSNDEKDLPDAFLRRCVFHYIQFPDKEQLLNILRLHYPKSFEELQNEIIAKMVEIFLDLREKMQDDKAGMGKKVSTSELLDWFRVLWKYHPDNEFIEQLPEKLLYPGVLMKSWEDYQRYVLSKDK